MSDKQCYLKFWFVHAIAKSAQDNQKQQHNNANCTSLNSANIQYSNTRNYSLQAGLFIKRLFSFFLLKWDLKKF